MADERNQEGQSSGRRRRRGLGRILFGLADQLFEQEQQPRLEPRQEPPVTSQPAAPEQPLAEPQSARSAAEATLLLEQALARIEPVPREVAELRRVLTGVLERVYSALDHLTGEARRLSDEASNLAVVSERLDAHVRDITEGLTGEAPRAPSAVAAEPEEPAFRPGGRSLDVVLAAVPGFQGLMDAQRGLSSLSAAEAASVTAFRNGEASLAVTLRDAVTPQQVLTRLRESTGRELVIEEARPEALRLRLRFVDGEGRG